MTVFLTRTLVLAKLQIKSRRRVKWKRDFHIISKLFYNINLSISRFVTSPWSTARSSSQTEMLKRASLLEREQTGQMRINSRGTHS